MNPQLLFDLLNRALEEEMGSVIETNNPQRVSIKLHEIKAANPKYAGLEITVPSTPNTVIIVKKSVELDEPIGSLEEGDLPDV